MSESDKLDVRILSSLKGKTISIWYQDPKFGIYGKTCKVLDVDSTIILVFDIKTGKDEGIAIDRIVRFEMIETKEV